MNKLKGYKFIVNRKKKLHLRLTPGAELGASQFSGIRARFRSFWKSQGLGGYGVEYMIEKHVFSNVLTDVDVLVFCIDGSSSKSI